jgi:hypothetical protein
MIKKHSSLIASEVELFFSKYAAEPAATAPVAGGAAAGGAATGAQPDPEAQAAEEQRKRQEAAAQAAAEAAAQAARQTAAGQATAAVKASQDELNKIIGALKEIDSGDDESLLGEVAQQADSARQKLEESLPVIDRAIKEYKYTEDDFKNASRIVASGVSDMRSSPPAEESGGGVLGGLLGGLGTTSSYKVNQLTKLSSKYLNGSPDQQVRILKKMKLLSPKNLIKMANMGIIDPDSISDYNSQIYKVASEDLEIGLSKSSALYLDNAIVFLTNYIRENKSIIKNAYLNREQNKIVKYAAKPTSTATPAATTPAATPPAAPPAPELFRTTRSRSALPAEVNALENLGSRLTAEEMARYSPEQRARITALFRSRPELANAIIVNPEEDRALRVRPTRSPAELAAGEATQSSALGQMSDATRTEWPTRGGLGRGAWPPLLSSVNPDALTKKWKNIISKITGNFNPERAADWTKWTAPELDAIRSLPENWGSGEETKIFTKQYINVIRTAKEIADNNKGIIDEFIKNLKLLEDEAIKNAINSTRGIEKGLESLEAEKVFKLSRLMETNSQAIPGELSAQYSRLKGAFTRDSNLFERVLGSLASKADADAAATAARTLAEDQATAAAAAATKADQLQNLTRLESELAGMNIRGPARVLGMGERVIKSVDDLARLPPDQISKLSEYANLARAAGKGADDIKNLPLTDNTKAALNLMLSEADEVKSGVSNVVGKARVAISELEAAAASAENTGWWGKAVSKIKNIPVIGKYIGPVLGGIGTVVSVGFACWNGYNAIMALSQSQSLYHQQIKPKCAGYSPFDAIHNPGILLSQANKNIDDVAALGKIGYVANRCKAYWSKIIEGIFYTIRTTLDVAFMALAFVSFETIIGPLIILLIGVASGFILDFFESMMKESYSSEYFTIVTQIKEILIQRMNAITQQFESARTLAESRLAPPPPPAAPRQPSIPDEVGASDRERAREEGAPRRRRRRRRTAPVLTSGSGARVSPREESAYFLSRITPEQRRRLERRQRRYLKRQRRRAERAAVRSGQPIPEAFELPINPELVPMASLDIKKDLIKLASLFDGKGMFDESDLVDEVLIYLKGYKA